MRSRWLMWVAMVVWTMSAVAFGADKKAEPLPIQLGAPFRDNAVLQRDMKLPVWGWSKPGTQVTVSFAGQTQSAAAGEDGKWMLSLDPLAASFEPREMVITEAGGESATIGNILVGEVWMASGQSNMQWTGTKASTRSLDVEPVGEKKVNPIREFEVETVYAQLFPIEKADGSWKDGGYTGYSAIAFAFAHKLYNELNVPIGILNCSFSSTAIEAWVPREGFRDGDEYAKSVYQRILETDPTTDAHKQAWAAFYQSLEDQIQANQERVKKGKKPLEIDADVPGNMRGNRDASWLFNGRLNPVIPYAIRGAIWNQGWASINNGSLYYSNLHSMIRGWRMVWDRPDLPVYFHQFYSNGVSEDGKPTIGGAADMRLATWRARDIPGAGMASQIDIAGSIHYFSKTVPGRRLALHALKNQYGKDVVAEGPMFKSYTVDGNKLTVSFENAEGGLVVADSAFNRNTKNEGATGFADPKVIENGDDKVKLFYLADEDRVWHPAKMKIQGETLVLTAEGVANPKGVTYGSGGIGFQPNVYNKALLPLSPFTYYDQKLVTAETWPDEKLRIAGEKIDPSEVGLLYEWRKMPILPPQFRANAVLQAGVPVTFWGSTQMWGEHGGPAEGKGVIHFEFGDVKKTLPVEEGEDEWSLTLPPMEATAEPRTLKVSFTIDGELAHERICEGIVVGDVVYLAAPYLPKENGKKSRSKDGEAVNLEEGGPIVRMIENQSKRAVSSRPSRFSVCTSRTPLNRFASFWKPATGLADEIGQKIAAKTGNPVGIIFMDSYAKRGKDPATNVPLKNWVAPEFLNQAPTFMDDYKTVGSQYPGNPYYDDNVKRYIAAWKTYWSEYIPKMIETKTVPDGAAWGHYPQMKPNVGDSTATHSYNIMVLPFSPAAVSAIGFLTSDGAVGQNDGAHFASEMAVVANCLKSKLDSESAPFVYTLPGKGLAAKIGKPAGIKGPSVAVPVESWDDHEAFVKAVVEAATAAK